MVTHVLYIYLYLSSKINHRNLTRNTFLLLVFSGYQKDESEQDESDKEDSKYENKKSRDTQSKSGTCFYLSQVKPNEFESIKNYVSGLAHYAYGFAFKVGNRQSRIIYDFFFQYTKSVRLSLKKLKSSSININRDLNEKDIEIIKANKLDIYEYGQIIKKGPKSIKDIKNMSKDEREELNYYYYNIVQKINDEEDMEVKEEEYVKDLDVIYVYGPPHISKNDYVVEILRYNNITSFDPVEYSKGFWRGVSRNNNICNYYDFKDEDMSVKEFIHFIDTTIHCMNIKNTQKLNRYRYIIITSITNPNDLYKEEIRRGEAVASQWMDKLRVINLEDRNAWNFIPALNIDDED